MTAAGSKQLGFSLIEVMSVVLLSGVLVLAAAPMVDAYSDQREALQLHAQFHETLVSAQEMALDSGDDVGVCASDNGKTCTNTSWEQGWLLYRGVEPSYGNPGVIESYVAPQAGAYMRVLDTQTQGLSSIRFSSRGFVSERVVASFCQHDSAESRFLVVERTGRLRSILKVDELRGAFSAGINGRCSATAAG